MTSSAFSNDFFSKNRQKIIDDLPDNSLAIVVANAEMPRNGDQFFPFRQNSNLLYLTGINQEKTILLLHKKNETKHDEILFVRKPSKDLEIWTGHKLSVEEATEISGIKDVRFTEDFFSVAKDFFLSVDTVFFELNEYPKFEKDIKDYSEIILQKLKETYPLHSFKRLYPIIAKHRLVKEVIEIQAVKKAIEITNEAFGRILKTVKPNLFEYEILAEINYVFNKNGIFSHAYSPIIACGKNNNILHYTENNCKCESGDLLLMDFGAEWQNYAADLTRTIPVDGKFSMRQKQVYLAVLEAQKFAKSLMKPGITINEINKQTYDFVCTKLLELNLLKEEELKKDKNAGKKYFMHGTSHFLGLDVHDTGTKDIPLQPGMILTCEPGIYIAEEGFGIRLENDILITEGGNTDLMENIPLQPEEIESLINA